MIFHIPPVSINLLCLVVQCLYVVGSVENSCLYTITTGDSFTLFYEYLCPRSLVINGRNAAQ